MRRLQSLGTDDHYLRAVNVQTGQEVWRFEAGDRVCSQPALGHGMVYFGSLDGAFYVELDATTGRLKWKFRTRGHIYSSPLVVGDVVLFGSYDGCAYAWVLANGQLKWKVQTGDAIHTSPAASNSSFLVAERSLSPLTWKRARTSGCAGGPIWLSPEIGNGAVSFGSDGCMRSNFRPARANGRLDSEARSNLRRIRGRGRYISNATVRSAP